MDPAPCRWSRRKPIRSARGARFRRSALPRGGRVVHCNPTGATGSVPLLAQHRPADCADLRRCAAAGVRASVGSTSRNFGRRCDFGFRRRSSSPTRAVARPLPRARDSGERSACPGDPEGGLGLAGARVSLLRMSSPGSIARRVVFVSAAALCLHGLRAKAGWGGHAHGVLDTAHAYLAGATWVVVVVGAAVAAHFLFRLAAPPRSVSGGRGPRRGVWWSWGSTSVALVCCCFGQELLEHLWVTGHLPALGVVWSAGGWSAVLLAGLLGAGVTAAARGSDAALELPFGGGRMVVRRFLVPTCGCRAASAHPWRHEPLAGLAAGRAPPLDAVFL